MSALTREQIDGIVEHFDGMTIEDIKEQFDGVTIEDIKEQFDGMTIEDIEEQLAVMDVQLNEGREEGSDPAAVDLLQAMLDRIKSAIKSAVEK